jgi:hypothetical protein
MADWVPPEFKQQDAAQPSTPATSATQEWTPPEFKQQAAPVVKAPAAVSSAWAPSKVPTGGAISGAPLTGQPRIEQKSREDRVSRYLFEGRAPQQFQLGEAGKEIALGAGGALAVGGVLAPFTGGMSLPIAGALAAGGGMSGLAGYTAKSLGTSRMTEALASFLGGGIGQAAAPMISRTGSALRDTSLAILEGNIPKVYQGLKNTIIRNEAENLAAASKVQEQVFGRPSAGRVSGEITGEYGAQTQAKLAAEHNIPQGQKASDFLRKQFYEKTGEAVQQGKTFSTSEPYKEFEKYLGIQLEKRNISEADYKDLVARLRTDQSATPEVVKDYGQIVDNSIRQWQGAMNAEGKAALDSSISKEIRSKLRDSFSKWGEEAGIGNVEKSYRGAYRSEKVAEAKDSIKQLISKYGTESRATDITQQLGAQTSEARPILMQELKTHFANTEPKAIMSEFERLDSILVKSGMLKPADLVILKNEVRRVAAAAKGESTEKVGQRVKKIIQKSLAASAIPSTKALAED